MVTIYHAMLFWTVEYRGPHNDGTTIWEQGASGVDIFFLISGFVMAISATGARTPTALDFMRRRIIRIVPLYWLVTLLISFKRIYLAFHPALRSAITSQAADSAISLRYLFSCLFFLPARDANGLVLPIINPGWTLNLEMFFYLLFAIALLLKIKPIRFLTPTMLLLVAIGVTGLVGQFAIAALTSPILLEFLAGVLLGYALRAGFRMNLKLAALLGIVGFAAISTVPLSAFAFARVLEWGIPALLLLTAAVMLEERYGRLWPAWILKIGDASYSLYLIHIMLLGPLVRLTHKLPIAQAHESVFVIGFVPVALLAALLSYWIIEKNLTKTLSRLTSTRLPVNIVERKTTAS